VLGNIRIGNHVKIGAGSVVIKSVPDNSTVVGVPGRIVGQPPPPPEEELEHGKLPDPEMQAIEELTRRIEALEREVRQLRENRYPEKE
jgi:serine O-acetyltransferase